MSADLSQEKQPVFCEEAKDNSERKAKEKTTAGTLSNREIVQQQGQKYKRLKERFLIGRKGHETD